MTNTLDQEQLAIRGGRGAVVNVRLAEIPMAGAIIGRALYEGSLTLADAQAAATGDVAEETRRPFTN